MAKGESYYHRVRALESLAAWVASVYRERLFARPYPRGRVCAHSDWTVYNLSGPEEWHDMRAPKTVCMRTGEHT